MMKIVTNECDADCIFCIKYIFFRALRLTKCEENVILYTEKFCYPLLYHNHKQEAGIMAETQFIKTVVFGGYDKNDVDKRLDYVYNLFFDNKNKLRETKLLLDKIKEGLGEQEALDSVLADGRNKLTELQVKNQNLVEKARSLNDAISQKDQEIASLKAKLSETEAKLTETEAIAASEGGANAGALFNVLLQQAQTSANVILSDAQKHASNLESDSKKLAENTITEANNKAKMIIYEAEKKAAEINAAAKEKAAAMDVASDNIKASVLNDVEKMNMELAEFKAVFEKFEQAGSEMIAQSQDLLNNAVINLTTGGVPVFREPEAFEAELVETPTLEDIDDIYITGNAEQAEAKSDALQKLKAKAESIGSEEKAAAEETDKTKVSLEELAKKAKTMK